MVWDLNKKQAVPLHREQVGWHYQTSGIDAALTGTYRVKLLNGREVDAMPVWQMYLVHFQDYDLDTCHQICRTPKDLMVRWARDSGTIKPAAIHNGEGTCHYFHQTINSRGAAMVLIITGNVGKFGDRATYLGRQLQGGHAGRRRPGPAQGWPCIRGKIPSTSRSDPNAHGKEIKTKSYYYGEEVGYWNHGDTALIVSTPKYGRKVFTGKTHMPTPSKFRWVVNVNVLNNAKHHYDMVRNVDPNIETLICQDIEMTSDVNHDDIAFAANSWMEFTYPEMTVTVSNPWVQIWKGGIRPLYDTRNDLDTFAGVAAKLSEMTGDKRMRDYFKFVYENRVDVYAQRMLDASSTLLRLQRRRDAEVGEGLDGHGADLSAHAVLGGDERVEADVDADRAVRELSDRSRKRSNTARTSFRTAKGPEATPYLPNAIMTHEPVCAAGRLRHSDHGAAP